MKIEIVVDEKCISGYVKYEGRLSGWNKATIHIPSARDVGHVEQLAILLHELGHVAGVVTGTLAQRTDIRFQTSGFHFVDQSMVASETEAWDLADRMYTQLKSYSKSTYGIKE